MPRLTDPIRLLKQAAAFFSRQQEFLDAARSAFRETHTAIRPGPQTKVNGAQVFRAITRYQLKQIQQSKSLPSNRSIAMHVKDKFSLSMSRAKVYVGIWRRWYWQGVITLTPNDRAWLEKHYPTVAKDFFSRRWQRTSTTIRRHSEHVKALKDPELDRMIDELRSEVWRLRRPAKKSDEGKCLTRAQILRLLKS